MTSTDEELSAISETFCGGLPGAAKKRKIHASIRFCDDIKTTCILLSGVVTVSAYPTNVPADILHSYYYVLAGLNPFGMTAVAIN